MPPTDSNFCAQPSKPWDESDRPAPETGCAGRKPEGHSKPRAKCADHFRAAADQHSRVSHPERDGAPTRGGAISAWMTTAEVAALLGVGPSAIHTLTYVNKQPLEWKAAGGGIGGGQGVGKLFLRADVEAVGAIHRRMKCTLSMAVRIFAAFPELRELR